MIGETFSAGQLIQDVMDSLLDGPGSYTREEDDRVNPYPVEEEQFIEFLTKGYF